MQKANFKFNWPLVGNEHITGFLSRTIAKSAGQGSFLSGAFIFSGPDNLGKTTAANYFAQSLLCENYKIGQGNLPCGVCASCRRFVGSEGGVAHGDFHIIKKEKDKKNISIEQIRNFIKTLSLSSFLYSYKIGVIKHADSLSSEAANALLKTLEEPKRKVIVILVVNNIDSLPRTIVSRSQVLRFNPVRADVIYDFLIKEKRAVRSAAKNYSRACLGRPALAAKFLENEDFRKGYMEKVNIFLRFSEQNINERLMALDGIVGGKLAGQEAAAAARRTLEVWHGLLRDIVFFKLGCKELIQHHFAEDGLVKFEAKIKMENLLSAAALVGDSFRYLKNNVNPKTVLENIAINVA